MSVNVACAAVTSPWYSALYSASAATPAALHLSSSMNLVLHSAHSSFGGVSPYAESCLGSSVAIAIPLHPAARGSVYVRCHHNVATHRDDLVTPRVRRCRRGRIQGTGGGGPKHRRSAQPQVRRAVAHWPDTAKGS